MLVDTMLYQIFMVLLVSGVSENREMKKLSARDKLRTETTARRTQVNLLS